MNYFILYLILINLLGAIVVCVDKYKAKTNAWRIPEKTLFIISFLGGVFATYIAMKIVRHKTRKLKFMLGLPLIMLMWLAIIYFIATKTNIL